LRGTRRIDRDKEAQQRVTEEQLKARSASGGLLPGAPRQPNGGTSTSPSWARADPPVAKMIGTPVSHMPSDPSRPPSVDGGNYDFPPGLFLGRKPGVGAKVPPLQKAGLDGHDAWLNQRLPKPVPDPDVGTGNAWALPVPKRGGTAKGLPDFATAPDRRSFDPHCWRVFPQAITCSKKISLEKSW